MSELLVLETAKMLKSVNKPAINRVGATSPQVACHSFKVPHFHDQDHSFSYRHAKTQVAELE